SGRRSRLPDWRKILVVGWVRTRGAISLAAALTLPMAFPDQSLIVFLTFGIIFSTLVLQKLNLPPLLRALRLADDKTVELEEAIARAAGAKATLKILTAPEVVQTYPPVVIEDLRIHHTHNLQRAARQTDAAREPDASRSADKL